MIPGYYFHIMHKVSKIHLHVKQDDFHFVCCNAIDIFLLWLHTGERGEALCSAMAGDNIFIVYEAKYSL